MSLQFTSGATVYRRKGDRKLPFSTAKAAHSLSTVFEGSRYGPRDQQKVVIESEPNAEKSCSETSDRLSERLDDGAHESGSAYLVLCGVIGQNIGFHGLRNTQNARFVSIPDGVEELCEKCFYKCKRLSRVTFGESSSLKLIGKGAFRVSGIVEIHIPDAVEKIGDQGFFKCESLSRVTFGEYSSLKLIGMGAFCETPLREIHIPDSVEELGNVCFVGCWSLSRVIFGESSSLKKVGFVLFSRSVCESDIPERLRWIPWRKREPCC